MARYEHTPIFQQTYILTVNVYKATSNFKREYKYTLGQELKQRCHNLLELIVKINAAQDKRVLLGKLNGCLEGLRIHLRLAFDLKVVSGGQLGVLNKQIEEIGKQIGGWQKWAVKN